MASTSGASFTNFGARFDPAEPLIVGWPDVALGAEQRVHLDHLAVRLGYLGRAESWVEVEALEWSGEDADALHMNPWQRPGRDGRFRRV